MILWYGGHREDAEMGRLNVYIHTVGCRANQADSSVLSAYLDPDVAVLSSRETADISVINTCCVTVEAERDCKKTARKMLRENSSLKVVFTGCAVSAFSEFAAEFSSQVVKVGGGATSPKALAGWINSQARAAATDASLPTTKTRDYDYFGEEGISFQTVGNIQGRTRALLKIQNGCSHNCSYCIVPKARGPEQSMAPEAIFEAVREHKKAGAMELVFTGVQIGAWGKELQPSPGLPALLDDAAQLFAPGRIRLSSIEPWGVDEKLIDVVANNDRICNHLHIPLQSGDDGVLNDMKRGYTAKEWLRIVQLVHDRIPGVSIGTDVICGFPTENERAFENSLDVLTQAQVAYVHAFSYSRRPGTLAAQKYGDNRTVAKERVRRLRELGQQLHTEFVRSQQGRTCEVFVEEKDRGLSDTFLPVQLSGGAPGELIKCVLAACPDATDSLCAKKNKYDK